MAKEFNVGTSADSNVLADDLIALSADGWEVINVQFVMDPENVSGIGTTFYSWSAAREIPVSPTP